jgi:peptidyl-prolyl cis-trans isomerase SurA
MIHRLRLLSLATSALLSAAALPAQDAPSPDDRSISRLGNGIAAIAEGQIITLEEIRNEIEPILPRIRLESKTTEEFNQRLNQMSREILQNRIDRIIIVQAARDKGLMIPQSYIDQEYDEVIARDFDGDRGKFIRYLKAQGETPRDYRKKIYDRVAVNIMRQQNRKSETEVSPERIQEFYQKNKLRFYQEEAMRLRQIILTPKTGEVPADHQATTAQIMEALENGRNFGDLAREFSTDNRSRQGGDWGWIKKADIRQELSTAAFALQPGEYSQALTLGETTFILYCEEKREETIQPVSQVRSIIENILSGEIARENQERWLQDLREKAYIKYYM